MEGGQPTLVTATLLLPFLFFANKTWSPQHSWEGPTLLSTPTRRLGREAGGHATLLVGSKAYSFQA